MSEDHSISRFFAARKDQILQKGKKSNDYNDRNSRQDEWETPIGLTPAAAIEICDDEEDNTQDHAVPSCCVIGSSGDLCYRDGENAMGSKSITSTPQRKMEISTVSTNIDTNANNYAHKGAITPTLKNSDSPVTLIRCDSSQHESISTIQNMSTLSMTKEDSHDRGNPFQQFAYKNGGCASSYLSSLATTSKTMTNNDSAGEKFNLGSDINSRQVEFLQCRNESRDNSFNSTVLRQKRRHKSPLTKRPKIDLKRSKKKRADNGLPFLEMTPEDQARCMAKWQSFADENAPLEIRRFEVFIAARLHCQAHESTVRAAMCSLRKHFSSSTPSIATTDSITAVAKDSNNLTSNDNCSGGNKLKKLCQQTYSNSKIFGDQNQYKPQSPQLFCPESLSKANPSTISQIISSILFANVKSKQIIKAAHEIKVRFRGIVPETQHGLQQLTGIGPKLGEILHHVNSYKAHDKKTNV